MSSSGITTSPGGACCGGALLRCLAVVLAVLAATFLLPASPCRGRSRHGAASGYNVVVITLDTVRADHLGCHGSTTARTPNIDALARSGIRFAAAFTPAPVTLPSHATLFTGLYPPNHGARRNGEYRVAPEQRLLAELFREHGYETAAFVGAFVLDARFGLDQGFDTYDDRVEAKARTSVAGASLSLTEDFEERDAAAVTDAALAWLASRKSDRPFFSWLHYFDAHRPWTAPPEIARHFPASGYDAEIAYIDSQIGRLLQALRSQALLARTIVVVVSDHGEGLGEHGEDDHDFLVYDSVMHVPLILTAPGVIPAGSVVHDRIVSTADLFPALTSLAGIPYHGPLDGMSLLDGAARGDRALYMESLAPYMDRDMAPLFALRTLDHKYIRAPRPELYDLRRDPGELHDLLAAPGPVPLAASELAARLETMLVRWAPPELVARAAHPVDDEAREKLAALGYLPGAGAGEPAASGRELVDPKDRSAFQEAEMHAARLEGQGQLEEAIAVLAGIVDRVPDNRSALEHMARLYVLMDRLDDAEGVLRRLLAIKPKPVTLTILGQLLIARERYDEVEWLARQALELDPRHGYAYVLLGDLAVRQARFAEAAASYARALEVDPYRLRKAVEERRAWMRRVQAAAR